MKEDCGPPPKALLRLFVHISKTKCNRQKPISYSERASKYASIMRKKYLSFNVKLYPLSLYSIACTKFRFCVEQQLWKNQNIEGENKSGGRK